MDNYEENSGGIPVPETEVVEPLTGSSVIIETLPPTFESPLPPMPEKKPGPLLRLNARPENEQKKTIVVLVILLIIIVAAIILVLFSKTSHIDYSETYIISKSLRKEVQSVHDDSSCAKVTDYASKSFVNMDDYQTYIKSCQTISDGPEKYIDDIRKTDGIKNDPNLRYLYDNFVETYRTAATGSKTLATVLGQYRIWHKWILTVAANTNEISWTDSDIESAANILTGSDVDLFSEYGEEWKENFGAYVSASRAYYTAPFSDENKEELRTTMVEKKKAYETWKTENDLNLSELIPLENPDTASLNARFEEYYNAIRAAYQENYDPSVGGCKELVNQIVCD